MQKNLPLAEAIFQLTIRFFIDFAALLQFLVKGKPKFAAAVSKAHLQFFKNFYRTSAKRSNKQQSWSRHTGVYPSSIVWGYFIKGIRYFSQLKDF